MKLVSWNLNGLEDENLDVRTEAAMFQLLLGAPVEQAITTPDFKPNTPDIVLLQEVVPRTFHAHIVPHLQAAGFNIYPQEPTERSYFEIIAVRQPIIESSYTKFAYTEQGRGLSKVEINNLTIMTAHMESQKPGASMRLDQATWILDQMNALNKPCIFAGDTNLRKAEWKSLKPNKVKDAWKVAGSIKAHKTTWQREAYKSRYDRVWTNNLTIKNFETFGAEHVVGINERPSDHVAIRVEFEF